MDDNTLRRARSHINGVRLLIGHHQQAQEVGYVDPAESSPVPYESATWRSRGRVSLSDVLQVGGVSIVLEKPGPFERAGGYLLSLTEGGVLEGVSVYTANEQIVSAAYELGHEIEQRAIIDLAGIREEDYARLFSLDQGYFRDVDDLDAHIQNVWTRYEGTDEAEAIHGHLEALREQAIADRLLRETRGVPGTKPTPEILRRFLAAIGLG